MNYHLVITETRLIYMKKGPFSNCIILIHIAAAAAAAADALIIFILQKKAENCALSRGATRNK